MLVVSNTLQNYIDAISDSIKSAAPSSSGALRSSIKTDIIKSDNTLTISLSMAEYGYYQDQGVDGTKKGWGAPFKFTKMPPPSKLDGWVVRNGIAPRNDAGQFTNRKGLNFVIARSIMENGIRPKNFIQPNIDKKLEGIADIVGEDIWIEFEKNINKKK